jgi:hypothetical protein
VRLASRVWKRGALRERERGRSGRERRETKSGVSEESNRG